MSVLYIILYQKRAPDRIYYHPNIAMWVAIQTRKRVLVTVMHCVGVASYGKNKENKERNRRKKTKGKSTREFKIF